MEYNGEIGIVLKKSDFEKLVCDAKETPKMINDKLALLQKAVEEMECVERDLRKLIVVIGDGYAGNVESTADFIHANDGAVTDQDTTYEPLIDFNYGYVSATLEGESTRFGKWWTLHKDVYIKMWDLPNIAELRKKYPIAWDVLIESCMPDGSTFKHNSGTAASNTELHTMLLGFELYTMG